MGPLMNFLPPFWFLFALFWVLCGGQQPPEGKCLSGRAGLCRVTPLGFWRGKPTYDPYEALGVPPNASLDSIQKAYRLKALSCHPDKVRALCGEESGVRTPGARARDPEEEPFVIINAAYEMLRRPQEREQFEREGSGDGGRFTKRENAKFGEDREPAKNTLADFMSFFAQEVFFGSAAENENNSEEEEEKEEEDSFSFFELFEASEEDEEEEEYFSLDFDSDFNELF
ncbi:hypothetical protein, conserved [Eimeria tenella]|uniref:J domain-containing protein n=1 Tax=Eimeria tenella TaxID=5802 RepID=U6KPQ0_EIMTE|nr:hypothetical protein, conserved [Eimeria tenella]CDJ38888.1 hypothetical protein, conserved [Eimeria tenella]|eukprot:XP_013229643.1 hypothetical protein, conserved [Eimeria tenella]